MKILIAPTIKESYKNQFEYVVDRKWFSFLTDTYGDVEIILPQKKHNKIDLIILCGGNDLISIDQSQENSLRYKQDKQIYEYALKKNIPLIGICYGAQFLSKQLNCEIGKVHNHVGNHRVNIINTESQPPNSKKIYSVNSFHNYGIIKASKKIIPLSVAKDNTVESFKGFDVNCLGIMWHPERFNKTRNVDKEIFLNFCSLS
tara:strand:- start:431 stop:1036 length:606 start_codon:yes stop_codon:yes gene_type:complete